MYPRIYNNSRGSAYERWKKDLHSEAFKCLQCEANVTTQPMISGVQNRNHCPYCLCSRHVDHTKAGDRLSACKAIMQPIGLTVKPGRNKYGGRLCGELMVIHRCSECGKLSINRLAADDQVERLLEIYRASLGLDMQTKDQLAGSGIRMLQSDDRKLVIGQLWGIERI